MRKPGWLTAIAVSGALLAGPGLNTPAAAATAAATRPAAIRPAAATRPVAAIRPAAVVHRVVAHPGSRHRAGPLVPVASAGVHAVAAELASASTGVLLWARHPDAERPIASITKVMTALVVIHRPPGPDGHDPGRGHGLRAKVRRE